MASKKDMTLREYIMMLNQFIKENPDSLDKPVVYCVDDEGNGYDEVKFSPSKVNYHGRGEATPVEKGSYNAVCLN